MIKFIELYICAIVLWISFYKSSRILFQKEKLKLNDKKTIIVIAIYSFLLALLNYYDSLVLQGVLKILCIYALFCTFHKVIFESNWSKVLVESLILYLCVFLSEIAIAVILSLVLAISNLSLAFLWHTITINILVGFTSYLVIKKLNKPLIRFINNSKIKRKSGYIIIFIILITMALLAYKIPVSNWKFGTEFILTMVILMCFCVVGLYLFKQKSDIEETTSKYHQEAVYSKIVSKVIGEYKIVNHEHKNQLSIIRGMTDKNNKKLLDYIDTLIEKKNDIKYKWVGELSYISLDGLKSLINYKLLEMEEYNINLTVIVSPDVSKIKLQKLTIKQQDELYSIIGIYLDNAMQAAVNSKEKTVSIDVYKENKELVFIIGNTFKNKIDLDKIDEYGYSTKGKDHGTGLHIVRNILEENNLFSQSRKVIDNYYIQELRVDTSKINKTTK